MKRKMMRLKSNINIKLKHYERKKSDVYENIVISLQEYSHKFMKLKS